MPIISARHGVVPQPAPGEVQVEILETVILICKRMAHSYELCTVVPEAKAGDGGADRRDRQSTRMYGGPVLQLGDAREGGAIGEVTFLTILDLTLDICLLRIGWLERSTHPPDPAELDTFGLPPQAFLGVAGMKGLTAWVGAAQDRNA